MSNLSKSQTIKALTDLRDEIAKKTGLESFKILQYQTIEAIADALPETLEELREIKGIGDKKLKQYGELILNAIHGEDKKKTVKPDKKEKTVFSVSEFLDAINELFYEEFESAVVRGEITGFKELPSGIYFSLKDKEDESILDCYFSPNTFYELGLPLEDGMEVKTTGTPGIWKPKGRLSFRVEKIELLGEGALKQAYKLLKKKLEEEGLFIRKRPLPEFIGKVGIITSISGAVIHDFRENLLPLGLKLALYDVRVEGARAVEEIKRGISFLNKNRPDLDVLVIMRGGGSLEDLQAFNNEIVTRAVFASKIPTIVAIGHDRDVPIASLVADLAVSTPTAAAVQVNHSWQKLIDRLPRLSQSLTHEFENLISRARYKMEKAVYAIDNYLERVNFKYSGLISRLKNSFLSIESALKSYCLRVDKAGQYLNSVNPEKNLKLGYSIVRNQEGKVVRSFKDVKVGERIRARVHQGEICSKVESIKDK